MNPGEENKKDREDRHLQVEVLAIAAGVKLERLREYEAGTYADASAAMQRELTLTIRTVEALQAMKPNLDLSDAASLRNLVLKAYWRYFGDTYARRLDEWKKTFEEMRKRGEAASDEPPYERPPSPSVGNSAP